MGMVAILVIWSGPPKQAFVPQGGSRWNLASTGLVVIEEKKFENIESEHTSPVLRIESQLTIFAVVRTKHTYIFNAWMFIAFYFIIWSYRHILTVKSYNCHALSQRFSGRK